MYTDLFGKRRVRLGLHHHTTYSDGRCTPEETVQLYRQAGYDAIAFTDHWVFASTQQVDGFPILSGCEYNVGAHDAHEGVWHIICLCAGQEPHLVKGASAQQIIDAIHEAGGLAVLAHPAWSLNTPQMIKTLRGIDAVEIYNTVSGKGMSRRADASLIVDMLATDGIFFPLIAADDSHYYESGNFGDACTAFIMAQCDSTEPAAILQSIREGNFYASTGPEIHLRLEGDTAIVDCSPASEILFMSNFTFSRGRAFTGEALTHAEYTIKPGESFIRAYITDSSGAQAWTNCIRL